MESGSLVSSGALRARGGYLRPLCRNFARGFCQWGQSCRFSHPGKSAHVCRYFQAGFCSYGERCSYEHIREEAVLPVETHYNPAPAHYNPAPAVVAGHWGLEPGCVPVAVMRGWGGAQRIWAQPVPTLTHVALKFASMEIEDKEKDKENIPAPGNVPRGATGGAMGHAQARGASDSQPRGPGPDPNPSDPREPLVETVPQTDPAEVPPEPGEALRARSEAVVCGICMDRVYAKARPEERLFGILPNCSHAYCLGCIRQWRRSRHFQSKVVKACPECRVTSSYYIPHKYWVSDVAEKEKLIKTFMARTGKIRCKFFVQNRGRCPFKSDCIYLHELPGGWRHRQWHRRPRVPVISPSSSESSESWEEEYGEDEGLSQYEWALSLLETGS